MRSLQSSKSGLTLVEVMTSLAILGFAMGGMLLGMQQFNDMAMDTRLYTIAKTVCMEGIQLALTEEFNPTEPAAIFTSTSTAPPPPNPPFFQTSDTIPATFVRSNLASQDLTGSNVVPLMVSAQDGEATVREGWVYRSVQNITTTGSQIVRVTITCYFPTIRGRIGQVSLFTLRSSLDTPAEDEEE